MSISQTGTLLAPTTVAVAPTETTLASFTRAQMKGLSRVSVQVYNADAAQTFNGIVYVKQTGMTAWSVFDSASFASVGPLSSPPVLDVDVSAKDLLEVRGTQSGAGGDVQICVISRAATP